MQQYAATEIRNIALIGHSGEGKTSIAECILYNAGAIDRIGKVTEGTTTMDRDAEEIARGISISLSLACCEWRGVKLNLLDVPGYPDFEGERAEALCGADCAIIVTSASGGVSVGTERAIKYCTKRRVPALLFINGTDRENADYMGTLAAVTEMFPRRIAPVHLPIMQGNKMTGYINVLHEKAYQFSAEGPLEIAVPEDMLGALGEVKAHLNEVAAENDEQLLEKFFASGTLSQEEMVRGVRCGIASDGAIPVLGGSAECNKGVFNLMDVLVEVMPSPTVGGGGENAAGFSGQVFKTVVDSYVGRLNLIKVKSGALHAGDTVWNCTKKREERIAALYVFSGKKKESVPELCAGDIGAVAKTADTGTGDTLCSTGTEVDFAPIEFPAPCFTLAVYAEKQGEEEKVFAGLYKLADEDPTLRIEKCADTGEITISGLGETQLDVTVKKLKAKFKVSAILRAPQIAYRETIRKISLAEGKHKKQSGGHGQYGHVKIRFEPGAGEDFVFGEEVVGGAVPKSYIPAVEKGLRECIRHGVLAGYPATELRAVLTDGSYHDVDSSELAFKIAASLAYREGMANANPVLLEPVVSLKVTVPDSFTGDIMGDINKRRGRILGMELAEEGSCVLAEAPMSELIYYATDLRSITQGRGGFTMSFVRYEEVPAPVADKIIKASKERNQ